MMKILHTADWHLGKRLEHFSRLEEQRQVLHEICDIADAEEVDAVLIAGDCFDQFNPPVEAIELFYQTLKRLSQDGKRAVIAIAGNHDAPDRIDAPDPLARSNGIFLAGYPLAELRTIEVDGGLRLTRSAPGFAEFYLPGCKQHLRVILTPYANETRLKRYLGEKPEAEMRRVLAAHWEDISGAFLDDQGINVLMTHLFVMNRGGDRPEEPEDERPVLTVGGAQEVYSENFPGALQYVALGHLHRPMMVKGGPCPVVYSGSPLSYSMSEAGQEKSVVIVEAEPGKEVKTRKVDLTKGRPLARAKFDDVQEALNWLAANPEKLVEITLRSDTYLQARDRQALYDQHDGIVALIAEINKEVDGYDPAQTKIDLSKHISSLFADYFRSQNKGQEPSKEILDLFDEVLAMDDSET